MKKEKIGILTMHYKSNYGGILQSMALYKIIQKDNYIVEFIDYRPSVVSSLKLSNIVRKIIMFFYKDFFLQKVNDYFSKLKISRKRVPQSLYKSFEDFKKANDLNYSRQVDDSSISNILNQYDIVIVGSDQVWSNLGKNRLIYMLDCDINFTGKLFAYAACSSNKVIPFYNRNKVRNLLSKFDGITVRDRNTYELIKKYSQKSPMLVADPSLLYDYTDVLDKKKSGIEPYLFVYILGCEIKGGHSNIIEQLKKKYGLKKVIAVVISDISLEAEKIADEVIYDASPSVWLNLLYNASFVYTDSFHGCMFSMKYKKMFIGYYVSLSRASRLIDLKERFSLSNIISSADNFCIDNINIDYSRITPLLEEQVKYSLTCLKGYLSFK